MHAPEPERLVDRSAPPTVPIPQPPRNCVVVDLTIPIEDGMDAFPEEPTARFTPFSTLANGGIEMWSLALFSQLGTHVDAPSHFLPDATTVESLDLTKCIGPVTVVDATEVQEISVNLVASHQSRICQTGRVIFRTGWSRYVGTPNYWKDFPELSIEASILLADWGISFVGLDTPTPSLSCVHEVHNILLKAGIIIAECLTNLELLSEDTYLVCLPLPLSGLDGSPARIIALESRME